MNDPTYLCATPDCGGTTKGRCCDACNARPGVVHHGYTMSELDAIAKSAANTARGKYASDWDDVYGTAWFGVVECLYTHPRPDLFTLCSAGQRTVNRLSTDQMHNAGYFKYKTLGRQAGPYSSPAFVQFWTNPPSGDVANKVVDGVAIGQILPLLTPAQRKVLMALAANHDYRSAADSIGMPIKNFQCLMVAARRRFFAAWHEGETPSRMWRVDKRRRTA